MDDGDVGKGVGSNKQYIKMNRMYEKSGHLKIEVLVKSYSNCA